MWECVETQRAVSVEARRAGVGSGKTEGLIPPWRGAVLNEVEIGVGGLIKINVVFFILS